MQFSHEVTEDHLMAKRAQDIVLTKKNINVRLLCACWIVHSSDGSHGAVRNDPRHENIRKIRFAPVDENVSIKIQDSFRNTHVRSSFTP